MRTSYLNNWYQRSILLVLACYSICICAAASAGSSRRIGRKEKYS
jgi:hypothetical protein